jgi:hypothetical protein
MQSNSQTQSKGQINQMELLQASIVNQIFGRGMRTSSKEQILQSGQATTASGQPKLINRRGVIMVEDQYK